MALAKHLMFTAVLLSVGCGAPEPDYRDCGELAYVDNFYEDNCSVDGLSDADLCLLESFQTCTPAEANAAEWDDNTDSDMTYTYQVMPQDDECVVVVTTYYPSSKKGWSSVLEPIETYREECNNVELIEKDSEDGPCEQLALQGCI